MMKSDSPNVVYVLPDKLGGVFNYVGNLLAHRRPDDFAYHAVLTDNAPDRDVRSDQPLDADSVNKFHYSLPPENIRSVLKRLFRAIPRGDGVLVVNDWLALAMSTVHDSGRTLVSVTHGDMPYYYELAVLHEPVIDCFLTYTDRMRDRLTELMPQRTASIFKIPYGVVIPARGRILSPGPLRLIYVGRLDVAKGILDLPAIDSQLRAAGVGVSWTVQGTGPDGAKLKEAWKFNSSVVWMGKQPMNEVLGLYMKHDVLVMPSRAEGLPVALLEAGAAGVVPVVTDLSSGIPEVVDQGLTGFRVAIGDIAGFASAIRELADDRARLEAMSESVRAKVSEQFDITGRAMEYQDLYASFRKLRQPVRRRATLHYGSRLDKPWMPNTLVRYLRQGREAMQGLGISSEHT